MNTLSIAIMDYMLSISHALTGAYIATAIPFPPVSVPLVLASHYLEDWTPHWDVGTGLSRGVRKRSTAFILGVVDLVVALGLVYLLWQLNFTAAAANAGAGGTNGGAGSINTTAWAWAGINVHAWLGAFVALVPDFLEAPRNFLKREPVFIKPLTVPLNNLHKKFHHSTPNMVLGLGTQVVVVGVILWLVLYR